MVIYLLAYIATFSGQIFSGEATLLQSNYFDTQHLLFRSSYFFRVSAFFEELLFEKSHFFAPVLFFRIETSTGQQLLEKRKFFRAVTFRNSYLFGGRISYNNDIGTSAQHQRFQKSYILQKNQFSRTAIFCITYFFWRATFLERLFFQKTLPSIAATFSEELHFHNVLFQKSYYVTAMLPFHSYTSLLSVSN